MTPGNITDDLVHTLVSGSHAEGIVGLHVAAAVEQHGQVLLIACDDNELDPSYELPLAAVLPGEHLLDTLCRCLGAFGLTVARVAGYLGYHDRDNAGAYTRAFCFAVTVTDPNAVRHAARTGHEWVHLDDLAGVPPSARPTPDRAVYLATHAEAHPNQSRNRLGRAVEHHRQQQLNRPAR